VLALQVAPHAVLCGCMSGAVIYSVVGAGQQQLSHRSPIHQAFWHCMAWGEVNKAAGVFAQLPNQVGEATHTIISQAP
jgi:hypothetical protein